MVTQGSVYVAVCESGRDSQASAFKNAILNRMVGAGVEAPKPEIFSALGRRTGAGAVIARVNPFGLALPIKLVAELTGERPAELARFIKERSKMVGVLSVLIVEPDVMARMISLGVRFDQLAEHTGGVLAEVIAT